MTVEHARIELRIPAQLKDWVVLYAKERNTSVSALVIRFLTQLHLKENKQDAEQV